MWLLNGFEATHLCTFVLGQDTNDHCMEMGNENK
jgi:hypothetical protein